MTRFKDLPISSKLKRMSLIVSASVLLLACAAFIAYDVFTVKNAIATRVHTNAEIVSINVAPALLFQDQSAAAETLGALRAAPHTVSAAVYTPDGKPFAKYIRGVGSDLAALPEKLEIGGNNERIEGGHLIVTSQIVSNGKPIGVVYMQADLSEITTRLHDYLAIALIVLSMSSAIAWLVSSRLEKKISGPILTLAQTSRAITSQKDYSLRAVVETRDEIGILGAAFNDMLDEVGRRAQAVEESHRALEHEMDGRRLAQDELRQINVKLQQRVAEQEEARQEIRDLNASLERRVAERTRQLEEANRAKSDFLANMSHELRTPLNSIIGFSEMLKDGVLGELDKKQRGFTVDIFDAGTHLLSLINDILDLSKIEAGMQQLEPAAVDVAALLKASMMVVREKALTHRIRLDTQLDPALDILLADERKVKQIVYNLLSNAVKFTPEGGTVTLRARLCTRSEVALDAAMPGRLLPLPPGEDNEFLALTVEDSGAGIAEEHLGKLFEPFTQVDSSITRPQGGTGLGLSLVWRLAELHGGTVGVASRPGVGSAFSVWLPYREATPAVQETRAIPEGAASPAPAVPLALVIEDDDRIAEMIEAQLRAEGFEVMRAATAEEGLVRAAKRRPQLITLDIFLPAMDGWEFMRHLKADPKLAATPVVIITVSEDMARGIALGARRVLQKPFVREELIAALAGLVDARSDGERARVLVVDDNVKAVELVAAVLQAEGYRVMRAYGGAEAIEAARRTPPDLVILDLMMPEVSGFEVARALRDSELTARIPILVLTAKDITSEDHARLKGGVSAILAKADFNASELLAELRRTLPKRAGD